MRELAMRPVHRTPLLGDLQDRRHLTVEQAMGRRRARGAVLQIAVAPPGPPAVHPIIGDLPQAGCPAVRVPAGDRIVDGGQDQFLHFGGDSRRDRSAQPHPDFPRMIANSIA